MLENIKKTVTKKSFKDRLKDTGFLLKNSFTIIGKDKDIKTPTIRMAILSFIMTTIFFLSIAMFLSSKKLASVASILMAIDILLLLPFSFFYYVRQKANQSWIVYNTLVGKDISYEDAVVHTKLEKGKLRLIAFVDMVVKYISGQKGKERKGVVGILINLFLSALVEIWDLLSHYMLPAVVIEQKSLKEIVPEIKELKNNVPATLAGVFGIDFAGNVISSLLAPFYLLMFAISVGLGYLLAMFTEATNVVIYDISFSWAPVLLGFYLMFVFGGVVKKAVESVKVIYFTIFYTSLTRPEMITPDIRGEITRYLLIKKDGESVAENVSASSPDNMSSVQSEAHSDSSLN